MRAASLPNVNKRLLKAFGLAFSGMVLEIRRFYSVLFDMRMELGWQTLFSLYLAAVLLVDGVSNEHTACTLTVRTDDISRATVAAAGVFEGRLELLGGSPASLSSPSLFVTGQLNATFTFRRSHKGRFRSVSQGSPRHEVVVRLGSTGDSLVPRTDSRAGCSLSDLLVVQRNYLVFVGQSVQAEDSEGGPGAVFQSTAFPVPLTRDAVRQVRAYQCRKCGEWFLVRKCLTVQQLN